MDILRLILDYAAKEWEVIKGAPGASLLLFVLALILAYFAAKWRYSAVTEALQGQRDLLRDQVADYRGNRSGLIVAEPSTFNA